MLLDVLEKISDTQREIARIEAQLVTNRESFSLQVNLDSLLARQVNLEEQFATIVSKDFMDICRYRFVFEPATPRRISDIGAALSCFQSLVSVVYDAIKRGEPKTRLSISEEAIRESSFEFGYSYPGSVGFVLTIPNERLVAEIPSTLDSTIETVFSMSRVRDTDGFHKFASWLGPAPLRALFRWADSHISSKFSADIQWQREKHVRSSLFIETRELEELAKILETASTSEQKSMTIEGQLFAGNLHTRTFGFSSDIGQISGRLSEEFVIRADGISEEEMPLGRHFVAEMSRTTTLSYATEEEKSTYTLHKLTERAPTSPV